MSIWGWLCLNKEFDLFDREKQVVVMVLIGSSCQPRLSKHTVILQSFQLSSIEGPVGKFVAFGDAVSVAGDSIESAISDPRGMILQLALVRAVVHH